MSIAKPKPKLLRQFAGLWLIVFPLLAALRVWRGHADNWAIGLAVAGVVVGLVGLVKPEADAAHLQRLDARGVSDRVDGVAAHAARRCSTWSSRRLGSSSG